MRITQVKRKEFIRTKLTTSKEWAIAALLKIYDFQTEEEQNAEATVEHNGVGFSGFDAEILSSFASQYLNRGSLSPRQMEILHKKMPRYWGQILKISDTEKLDKMILTTLN